MAAGEDQGRIKEAVLVQKYIDPVSEKIEDSLDQAELFEDIAASYSITQEEVPDDDLDPIIPLRPAQALASIQTLKDWEEQQDDSTQLVVKQLKDLEKRVRALQLSNAKQTTLDSYLVLERTHHVISSFPILVQYRKEKCRLTLTYDRGFTVVVN
jgi:inorganic pyrophosphatase